MAEFFQKSDRPKEKPDLGKVHFSVSEKEQGKDIMIEKRAAAQRFVGSPTSLEDYRYTMWQLHEEFRKNAESRADIVQDLELRKKSPAAFSVHPGGMPVEIEARRIEHAKIQAEYEIAKQAIWSGMQAWGKGQVPNAAFFQQLRLSIQDAEKREVEAFTLYQAMPADPYRLETWKQVARKKQILVNFEKLLQTKR